ncbi:MAG TPA: DUF5676 family membrane protein [Patescibacteria group bacterium]|nr:DUF5676 family membrane protein [Patescibacteria group bacterium]
MDKHYCQINTQGFALAFAGVAAIIYLLCTIVVAFLPDLALQLFGSLVHLVNLEKAADMRLTLVGFVSGLFQAVIYTYIGAWLVAWLHNLFCKE